ALMLNPGTRRSFNACIESYDQNSSGNYAEFGHKNAQQSKQLLQSIIEKVTLGGDNTNTSLSQAGNTFMYHVLLYNRRVLASSAWQMAMAYRRTTISYECIIHTANIIYRDSTHLLGLIKLRAEDVSTKLKAAAAAEAAEKKDKETDDK